MRRFPLLTSVALATMVAASSLSAQTLTTSACPDNGGDRPGSVLHWIAGQERACELRSAILPLNGPLRV